MRGERINYREALNTAVRLQRRWRTLCSIALNLVPPFITDSKGATITIVSRRSKISTYIIPLLT